MQKQIRLIFIMLVCSVTYACTLLQTTPDSLNNNITEWLAENEFDKIDHALKKVDKNDTKYTFIINKTNSIIASRNTFIEKTSATAIKYRRKNQWQKALQTYDHALDKIEDEPRLLKEKTALLKERDRQITNLRKDMLMKRADALISYKIIYSKLHKLIPEDYSAQFDINRFDNDRIEVANQLRMCGEQAIKNNNYTLARDCYYLSNELEPSKPKTLWVTKLNKQLKDISNQKRHIKLLSAYQSAYDKHEYDLAKSHLNELLTISPSHSKAKALLASLNKEVQEWVSSKIEVGKERYSKKKINAALEIWRQALRLEPENPELLQLISRAEKISQKIQSLEKTQ